MHVECKCMLKEDDKFILGEGRAHLLELIDELGSISKAAENMGMSYRYAWGVVKDIESSYGKSVIETKRGGEKRGGSSLTKEGKKLLSTYDELCSEHEQKVHRKPALTVDGIISTKKDDDISIVLIERKNPPYEGQYALPGGFVEYNEKLENAVIREIQEETGLQTKIDELVGVYSDPERDPRGHTVSAVFSLDVEGGKLRGATDAVSAEYVKIKKEGEPADLPELAFDHDKIIKDFLDLSGH